MKEMEKNNKVRITCVNCLYSKILPIHKSDPKGTRFVFTETCVKCNEDGVGIYYFNSSLVKLTTKK